jgi:hypothetical protein
VTAAVYNLSTSGKLGTVLSDFGAIDLATASVGIIAASGTAVVSRGTYALACKLESLGSAGTHPTIKKHNSTTAAADARPPYGYSGTRATDFATSDGQPSMFPMVYTGLSTGAFPDLTSSTPVQWEKAVHFDFAIYWTFQPATTAEAWAWGSGPAWQVVN